VESPVEKKRRGLLVFYITAIVVLILAVCLAFVRKPLEAWYWEKKLMDYVQAVPANTPVSFYIRRPDGSRILMGTAREGTEALERLVAVGPAAAPAIERIIASLPADRQMRVMDCLAETGEAWAVRALVSSIRDGKPYLARDALGTAERLTGQVFFPNGPWMTRNPNPPVKGGEWSGRALSLSEVKPGRERFLTWWEREGKAKYGRSE
jgi:hypothetical protein